MATPTSPALENLYLERGFGGTIGFGHVPALVVVDMQVGFTDPALPLGSNQDGEIETIRELLSSFRRYGHLVVFLGIRYEEKDCADAGVWRLKNAGVTSLAAGAPATEIDPRLQRVEGEPMLYRRYPSGFFGTDLSTRLTTRGVDTAVVVGCTTSGCVRATVVDALQYGFRPIVAMDAVADRSPEAHNQSLVDMQAKYADVMSAQHIAEALDHLASALAGRERGST